MNEPAAHRQKVVIFSGSGISAPSGIPTFRDAGGLWRKYRFDEVASPQAWRAHPEVVLEFYNERREKAAAAQPNAAHVALARLEQRFDVVVVTQNVDDLHERGGSTNVIHLHGELRKARSSADPELIYDIGAAPIRIGDRCDSGSQLRPHIVWFGENIMCAEEAVEHISGADRFMVVGTSLNVYPAAGFVEYAPSRAMKVVVDMSTPALLSGFEAYAGSADIMVPQVVDKWMSE